MGNAKNSSATHMPTSNGWVKGFSPDAEIESYNSLYDKVMADEKQHRLSQGLPAEEPGFWGKMKTKVQGNNDARAVNHAVKDTSDNASRDEMSENVTRINVCPDKKTDSR